MLPKLCGNLLQFRTYSYEVIADIEEAFLQIELHENDRDMMRFLWLKEQFLGLKPTNLEIYRFRRIAFSVISSPFLLTATVAYHLRRTIEEAFIEGNEDRLKTLKQIKQQIYVDNLITECTSQDEVINCIILLMKLFVKHHSICESGHQIY